MFCPFALALDLHVFEVMCFTPVIPMFGYRATRRQESPRAPYHPSELRCVIPPPARWSPNQREISPLIDRQKEVHLSSLSCSESDLSLLSFSLHFPPSQRFPVFAFCDLSLPFIPLQLSLSLQLPLSSLSSESHRIPSACLLPIIHSDRKG